MEPAFIIEDSCIDNSSIIFLVYNLLDHCGKEHMQLLALDYICVSDILSENHKIALERVMKLKHASVHNTSQRSGGKIK